jgi:acyl-[acyl carrier protein]--UDP-N-acetylglucosamine O-acyltransferase
MRRKGWSKDTIQGLREAYKLIFKSGLTSVQAVEPNACAGLPDAITYAGTSFKIKDAPPTIL